MEVLFDEKSFLYAASAHLINSSWNYYQCRAKSGDGYPCRDT